VEFPGDSICNSELAEKDIPKLTKRWDDPLIRFALSFDAYEYTANQPGKGPVSRLAAFARPVVQVFAQEGSLPESLSMSDLRACLFWEQRRDRHAGTWEIEGKQVAYISALLNAIRVAIRAREAE
jgi:hypothetical protein